MVCQPDGQCDHVIPYLCSSGSCNLEFLCVSVGTVDGQERRLPGISRERVDPSATEGDAVAVVIKKTGAH